MSRADLFSDRVSGLYVFLVEIQHPAIDPPIRIVVDNEGLTALGHDWMAGQISLLAPSEVDGARSARITVQNVDRRIGDAARQMVTPATVYFRVVERSDPDVIEVEYPPLHIANITGDAIAVTGDLVSILNPLNPARNARATKDTAPGAFR